MARSVPRDSLPAGTRINIVIQQPGDPTTTNITYVVPAPPVVVVPPKPIDPQTTKLFDGLQIGLREGNKLSVRLWNSKPYLSETLSGGQILVRGPNLLLEKNVISAYKSRVGDFAGGATAWGGLTEPAGVVAPSGYVRRTFSDGAVYYIVGVDAQPGPVVPDVPKPDVVVPAKPAPSSALLRSTTPSKLSDQPFGYNRLQVKHPPYQDGWVYKSEEIALQNAPGFPNETPDLLREHGHNVFNALWFFGSAQRDFGLPKKTDKLYFEVGGASFNPYRTVWSVLSNDLQTIGESISRTLPQWNTTESNGLIDGVGTVKECHLNLEYAWFGETGTGENRWQGWSDQMRQSRFVNYDNNGQVETFQQVYDRGGVNAINRALHQKWRNITGLAIAIINRHSAPMRAYYGDFWGIAPIPSIRNWEGNYRLSELFTSDVNDGGKFGEANETLNAGRVVLNGHDAYDISGNLRRFAGISNAYNYEWAVKMKGADYDQFINLRGPGHDIRKWQDKMVPDLYRPYDRALHAQLTEYVKLKKGWPDYKVYWFTEPIYESSIYVEGRGEVGAWVGWTLDAQKPFDACKIPLHAEVCDDIVFNARMRLDGLTVWGGYKRQKLPEGKSENVHPWLHQTGHEGFQRALDEINQYDAFGPDTKRYFEVPTLNAVTGQYVTADASTLLLANGKREGKPHKPVPLVSLVHRPSTGVELYSVYAVHEGRYDTSEVKFRSPVDGAELTATAVGWGPVLYVRSATAR